MRRGVPKRLPSGPVVSVVIPTHNRAPWLGEALASVAGQDFPKAEYEIIVVDNASTDHTAAVVEDFKGNAPVRYVKESSLGLCVARNTGWRAAVGRWIAFLDDDAVALPGWLGAIRRGFEGSPPDVAVVGGRVDPIWEAPRPAWLADEIAYSLTIVDWGPADKILEDINRQWLVGANFAVRRDLLEDVGGFHPWLDRVGNNLLSSGDVFLQKEVIRQGYGCLYFPSMAVRHLVPAARLRPEWFLRRYFWQGVSDAVMYIIEEKPAAAERVRLAAARAERAARRRPDAARSLVATESAGAFTANCFALIEVGFVAGLLGAAGH
jgi:glycosyltransferase involved in cell wall biosynthesis